MHRLALTLLIAAPLALRPAFAEVPAPKAVVETYATIAEAMFADTLTAAQTLQQAVTALLANPSEATLTAARAAWVAARVPYSRTEALRFGNRRVDDKEGQVNAWPLDEGLIDYVADAYGEQSDENPLYRANVIANPKLRIGKKIVDAATIDVKLLRDTLHHAGGVEANVATGYHAIEFLLWGQDLNGTGPGAGTRPATDYDLAACTGGHCDRRRAYLTAATELLVADLTEMAADWRGPDGAARRDLAAKGPDGGLATILTGIGSLSYGELAGERMKLGVLLHDTEEEQDCFSDNTANEPVENQRGILALYTGSFTRLDGTVIRGAGLADLAAANAPSEAASALAAMRTTMDRLTALKARADAGMAYDQMLASGNAEGNRLILDGVEALVAQTRAVEAVVAKLKLKVKVEGSASLDSPAKVRAK